MFSKAVRNFKVIYLTKVKFMKRGINENDRSILLIINNHNQIHQHYLHQYPICQLIIFSVFPSNQIGSFSFFPHEFSINLLSKTLPQLTAYLNCSFSDRHLRYFHKPSRIYINFPSCTLSLFLNDQHFSRISWRHPLRSCSIMEKYIVIYFKSSPNP